MAPRPQPDRPGVYELRALTASTWRRWRVLWRRKPISKAWQVAVCCDRRAAERLLACLK